jgi:hypothetical protein
MKVATANRLDALVMISVRDARDSLERQLRITAVTGGATGRSPIDVTMALDEATGLLMDLDTVLETS